VALSAFQPPCSHRNADPALPAPYKGRPLYVPTKTIFTILLSQIRRASSPCTHANADPKVYRPKPFHNFFSQIRQASSPLAHAKADPHAYRPKPFQASCSHRCAQQLSHCPCKGRPLHLPTKTHVNKLVLT
jgi:hypothetical protein